MKLRNTTGQTVDLPTLGLRVEAGETVEVTGDDAKSLQAQGWARADRPQKRAESAKAAKADDAAPKGDDTPTDEAPASKES